MTLALATLGELPEDGAAWDAARAPDVPPPPSSPRLDPDAPGVPVFMRNYDMRWAALGPTPRPARRLAARARAPRTLDAPLVAAMTDAWVPAAFARPGRASASRRRSTSRSTSAAPLPARRRWRRTTTCSAASSRGWRWAACGRRTASCGRPTASCIAQSRQLALIRELPCVIGYLGLGSNVGDRRANLQAAVDALPGARRARARSSSVYDTEPVGEVLDQPEFLNAACGSRPSSGPRRCSTRARRSSASSAALAGGVRHGPRPIDVDLLLLGDETLPLGAADAPARAR